jgi:hypothetical protein
MQISRGSEKPLWNGTNPLPRTCPRRPGSPSTVRARAEELVGLPEAAHLAAAPLEEEERVEEDAVEWGAHRRWASRRA